MFRCLLRSPSGFTRGLTTGLPFRIRVPLKKLQERKNLPQQSFRPAALGDGEQLETSLNEPDYLRLALTSRVYDLVSESPLQYAPGLSHRLQACVHIKREDVLPSFSYRIRGAFNLLDALRRDGVEAVVTYSIGSQGHSLAVAAQRLGMEPPIIVVPERTPLSRKQAMERAGAVVHVYGRRLKDAQAEAERLAAESKGKMAFLHPHDDPRVIAGQATAGLEITRQHGRAVEDATGGAANTHHLDAIFVCTGGSSLLAGIALAVKQVMPTTRVIGVEPADNNLLQQSLLAGHRVEVPEPSHFVDGAAVTQIGPEVFRLCDELVDDIVTVSNDEICAAVRDCFEDTRAMLEPAGAISVAGLKRWLATQPKSATSNGNYVVVSSDASNIEFDILRFIAERASMGEQKERLFALELPDETGAFYRMYKAVQPRAVTEFVYRHDPRHRAMIYMCVVQADDTLTAEQEVRGVVDSLTPIGVEVMDVTSNEMAKTHARYLVGSRPNTEGERVLRFEFPEVGSGSIEQFLSRISAGEFFLTLLHYRNHGGQVGKVLAGIEVPEDKEAAFEQMLDELGYTFHDETENPIFQKFMR
uniref:Threonine dehydratase n=1 Tax=Calcidiscus leptoporus TaxID=127549 RepID=A0A7S0P4G0_9EUKA|mmetsp:Transcript_60151/g.137962  ORF Transcript_60151/g.137962 Transcript_60151/m.137962 type:complete len:586 (+) Transcript_60151:157-1914(+)